MSLLAAGVGVASNLVGSLFQNRANRKAAEREYKYNLKLMQYQNEYNNPKSQMSRLRAAGLNPMLVYGGGSGAVSGNLTGNLPQYREAPKTLDLDVGKAAQEGIKAYQLSRWQKLNEDKLEADLEATRTNNQGQAIVNDINATRALREVFEYGQDQNLAPYNLELKKINAERAAIDAANAMKLGTLRDEEIQTKQVQRSSIIAGIAKMQADTKHKNELLKLLKEGRSPNDPILYRLGRGLMDEIGVSSWKDLFKVFTVEQDSLNKPESVQDVKDRAARYKPKAKKLKR